MRLRLSYELFPRANCSLHFPVLFFICRGKAIIDLGIPRADLVISTKVRRSNPLLPRAFPHPTPLQIYFGIAGRLDPNAKGLSRKHIIEGTNDSLKRLQMDYGTSPILPSVASTFS